jgi:glycosyltransferase involved in cell wall biosynthesis
MQPTTVTPEAPRGRERIHGCDTVAVGGHDTPAVPRIAVLIPCRNEAPTIAGVVDDFRAALPGSAIFVYDNNSTDETTLRAAAAGAVVRHKHYPDKGSVLRRMFADVDIYVLADGDGTYDAAAVSGMVRILWERSLDLVNGNRVGPPEAYRPPL